MLRAATLKVLPVLLIAGGCGPPRGVEYGGMLWRVGPDRDITWFEARDWVTRLGEEWRLPTLSELGDLHRSGVTWGEWGPFENSGFGVWSTGTGEDSALVFYFIDGTERREHRGYSSFVRVFAVGSF